MFEKGKGFEEVLKKAQELGYAERNPEADIEGHDACRKIAILASIAWGKFVDCKQIHTEGITKITLDDVKCAEKLGMVIKLIGYADTDVSGRVYARVSPMLIPKSSPMANVRDVFNAVTVSCDNLGDAMFYGRGAGKLPTASAVVSDIIECQKHGKMHTVLWEDSKEKPALHEEQKASYMVRVAGGSGKLDGFEKTDASVPGEKVYITPEMTEGEFEKLIGEVGGVLSKIRIYTD